jgi:hypothetical protein
MGRGKRSEIVKTTINIDANDDMAGEAKKRTCVYNPVEESHGLDWEAT